MSIEETWHKAGEGTDADLSSLLQGKDLLRMDSHHPLRRIRRNLLYNLFWGVLVCIGYILIIFYFHAWQVQFAIIITLVFSVWGVYTAGYQYKKLDARVYGDMSLLSEMKRHHQSLQMWMKTQLRVALFVYPVSAAGGFLLGGIIGSGKPVAAFISKPFVQVSLLITIIILVPIAYWAARRLFAISFGKHLDALQNNIRALEEEK